MQAQLEKPASPTRQAAKTGRPYQGGGVRQSFRLSCYLITKMGLQQSSQRRNADRFGEDTRKLKAYLNIAIDHLTKNPDSSFKDLEPPRAPEGSFAKGWGYEATTFNLWIPAAEVSAIAQFQRKGESLAKTVQRLIVVACAVKGIQQTNSVTIEDVPSREEYQRIDLTQAIAPKDDLSGWAIAPKQKAKASSSDFVPYAIVKLPSRRFSVG